MFGYIQFSMYDDKKIWYAMFVSISNFVCNKKIWCDDVMLVCIYNFVCAIRKSNAMCVCLSICDAFDVWIFVYL